MIDGGRCTARSASSISSTAALSEASGLMVLCTSYFVQFVFLPDASLSSAVDEIKDAEQALHLPPSITTSFQGAAQAFQDSLSSEVFLLLAALVTVYLVLGVLYESYIHPVTILSTLPSAGIGALLALMLAGSDLDVIGIIGIVLLIGIVKKNGIMIVDFALEAERKHGKSPEEAIFQASIAALSPDHDDHARRHARRIAAPGRHRHGLGTEPAAGAGDHRRSAREPDVDAVHHPGDLPFVRSRLAALRTQGGRTLR